MNQQKIEKEIKILKIYAVVMTLVCAIIFLSAFSVDKKAKFSEINVERINIVEKSGKLKMVISNKERQHPGIVDGKYFKEREGQRVAGLIFFSEKGDEIGGLIFDGNNDEGQFGSLTFDKFRGDQTIQFIHNENKEGNYYAGLNINDENLTLIQRLNKIEDIEKLPTKEEQDAAKQKMRDKGEFLVNRLFIGRGRDKSSTIILNDAKGKPRIRMLVEPDGKPKLNFLDENGKVFYSLPENAKIQK